MMLDFFQDRHPPNKRVAFCEKGKERHLSEGAVILAFAIYLLGEGADTVELHPDGEHGKRFPIRACLESRGFVLETAKGKTEYGGTYRRGTQTLTISLRPGLGDVVADLNGQRIIAECKGGVVNTRHSGQLSRLRSGFCEAVGQLMSRDLNGDRHIAVMPETSFTERLAMRSARRAKAAGIEFALVSETGQVIFVKPESESHEPD